MQPESAGRGAIEGGLTPNSPPPKAERGAIGGSRGRLADGGSLHGAADHEQRHLTPVR